MMDGSGEKRWMKVTLRAAGVYNVAWGAWVLLFPLAYFRMAEMPLPNYPQIWQCVGMIVGVYGVGYWIAASDPVRHWPIILVGLLGKIFGPIGFLQLALRGDWPWLMGWTNITNDLIWWIPFTLILLHAYRVERSRARDEKETDETAARALSM